MADVVNILWNAETAEASPRSNGYSGVRIIIGTDEEGNTREVTAGNMDGNVLEIKNPFGTQQMANDILEDVQGYQYQPLDATGALMNPAAEMGDGVAVNGVYTGLYVRATKFGRLMKSDIGAPTNQEIEHEYAVESATDRQYSRFVRDTKAMLRITNMAIEAEVSARESADSEINATLSIQATEIAARVTKTGGNNSSFGWVLNDNSHTWYSGSQQVMKVNSSGLEVTGKITATSGKIGGFTIGTSSIYSNGMSSMSSTQTTGVHVGTDGIKLGQNFKVDTSGNVTGNNMTLTGTLTVGGSTITAENLRLGANRANNGYSNWNSAYTSTSAGGYCYKGAGAGYSAQSTWDDAQNASVGVGYIKCGTLTAGGIWLNDVQLVSAQTSIMDGNGRPTTLYYFAPRNW